MGNCTGKQKDESQEHTSSQDPSEAIDKTRQEDKLSFNSTHKDLQRKREWKSEYTKKDATTKIQKKRASYLSANNTFTLAPPVWELNRESIQVIAAQECKVLELYSGELVGMEQRDDRNVYHMRTDSISCTVTDPSDEEIYDFNVEYNEDDLAQPLKKHVYKVPGNGYLQLGPDELCWHLNDDNEEIWIESRGGETKKLLSLVLTPREDRHDVEDECALEVGFVPDDGAHWSLMQQTINRIMQKPKQK